MPESGNRPPVGFVVARHPELSETFVRAEARGLQDRGRPVVVEALRASSQPDWEDAAGVPAAFAGGGRRVVLGAVARVASRTPAGVMRDVAARRDWRPEYVAPLRWLAPCAVRLRRAGAAHLHAHFADEAALAALRLARLLGVPYSVTAHAYEIFAAPANLAAKVGEAAFVTTGCEYNVRAVERLTGVRPHKVIMGVDGNRFRRERPHPADRRVVAVGRLVEKKGFGDLVEAASALYRRRLLDELVLIGDGPLEESLRTRAREHGLGGVVRFTGSVAPAAVRAELERAAVLAMPCVVAANGDRDSMPVVVKEALAMEVPVVGTREVGLPEVIRDEWGRLAAPRDPASLSAALGELLEAAPEQRAAMGARGREFVLRFASVERQAEQVDDLIDAVAQRRPTNSPSRAPARRGDSRERR